MENSVDIMIRVKELLDNLIDQEINSEYTKIVELVDNYINKNCAHNIITDSIDIDPERSQTIYYCEKCAKNFDFHQGQN